MVVSDPAGCTEYTAAGIRPSPGSALSVIFFRTHAQHDGEAFCGGTVAGKQVLRKDGSSHGAVHHQRTIRREAAFTVDEVDARVADEIRNPKGNRVLIQIHRRSDLLQLALKEDGDAGGHGKRLHLIVRYIKNGGSQLMVQALDFRPHIHAQLCIQVGKRLIQQ